MGRYTRQNIDALLAADDQATIVLLLYDDVGLQNIPPAWRTDRSIELVQLDVPEFLFASDANIQFDVSLQVATRLKEFVETLHIDIFHNSTPFVMPYPATLPDVPIISTCYDLIPLIFPFDYFVSAIERQRYLGNFQKVVASKKVVAISRTTAGDLISYGGYPAQKIQTIYPLIIPYFAKRRMRRRSYLRKSPICERRFF